MTQYMIQIARELCNTPFVPGDPGNYQLSREHLLLLVEELDRLHPWDFETVAHYDFIFTRQYFRDHQTATVWSHIQFGMDVKPKLEMLIELLGRYVGEGSRGVTRSFDFTKDDGLRSIIERDYKELKRKVFPSGAWKSTVVLAGSIFEAILLDQITHDPAKVNAIKEHSKKQEAKEWNLSHLIKVAADHMLLPEGKMEPYDTVLRDYRNFIHPDRETRAKHECGKEEAGLAIFALDKVYRHLAQLHKQSQPQPQT